MINASRAIPGLLASLLATAAARADTISGVSVERVFLGRSDSSVAIELRIRTESEAAVFIAETVPPGLVVTGVGGGGVLVGQGINWAVIFLGPGLRGLTYHVAAPECAGDIPIGPGTFQVGDDECPIDGDERGDCAKVPPPPPETLFLRGDFDQSAVVDISDAINILNFLFLGGSGPACPDGADADDNGAIELSDAVRVLDRIFLGGLWLPAPGPQACGPDPTPDGLGCGRGC